MVNYYDKHLFISKKKLAELQMTTYFNGEWTRITEIPHDF